MNKIKNLQRMVAISLTLAGDELGTADGLPFLRTITGQRCFSYQGAKLWNGLSQKTKNTSNLKDFMKAIK